MIKEEGKEKFQLIDITKADEWEQLLELCFAQDYEHEVLYRLLSYLREFVNLQTILVEQEYIDADYRNEFSFLYSKTFKQYPSTCKRLHLFGEKPDKIEKINELGISEKIFKYLGYIIVRPVDVGKVGRTVITYENNIFNANRDYVLCRETFTSHISGKELKVIASPFIEQDSMVMTCAQSSIWMAARYMHKKFGFPCHLPHEITDSASTALGWAGRALPSEGLTVHMMLNALNNMGYSPIFLLEPVRIDYPSDNVYKDAIDDWNENKKIEYIYKYVESEIPVILMMPLHAITVVGHTFDPYPKKVDEIIEQMVMDPESKKAVISSHHWVDSFIVHDDRDGPYKILPVSETHTINLIDRGLGSFLPKGDVYKAGEQIEGIIVPLPEKIYLLGMYIDKLIKELIEDEELTLMKVGKSLEKGCKYAEEFLTCLIPEEKNPIVTRSYFTLSSTYKAKILDQSNINIEGKKSLHKEIIRKYINMPMPKFIWVTELTTKERLSKENEEDRTIFGEIIFDTTANKNYNLCFLTMHFPGVFIEQDYQSGVLKDEIYIPDDEPYRHISRQGYGG